MFTRLKKIEKKIKKLDNPNFLKTIGIKKIYIKNFLKAFEEKIQNENDKLRIFRAIVRQHNRQPFTLT